MKSTTKIVKDKINAHILEYFHPDFFGGGMSEIDNLKDQLSVFDYMPTDYAKGKYMAEGGTFLIYTKDQEEFLNGLGINPDNKEYPDHKIFEQYCHLIARQIAELVRA